MAYANAYNNVTLMGRLTRDPEVKTMGKGKNTFETMKLNIAVPRKLTKEQRNDSSVQNADFIVAEVVGNAASVIEKYFKKGDPITIMGSIRSFSYENSEGDTVFGTSVSVVDWSFGLGYQYGENDSDEDEKPKKKKKSKPEKPKKKKKKPVIEEDEYEDDEDDDDIDDEDIPF